MINPVKTYYVDPKIFSQPVVRRNKQHKERTVTPIQHSVLWFLKNWGKAGISASEVGLRVRGGDMDHSRPWAYQILKALEKKGYVNTTIYSYRKIYPFSAERSIHYYLSDKAKEYLRKNPYPEIEPLHS